ncbi:glycosyltransferase 87 family protein, partial [Acinetobacter baumannii]
VLIAQRRWDTIAAAATTVLGLAGAATAAFGADIWTAFRANMPLAGAVLEQGLVDAYKLQSTYAAVRVLGGTHGMAGVAQGIVTLAVLAV